MSEDQSPGQKFDELAPVIVIVGGPRLKWHEYPPEWQQAFEQGAAAFAAPYLTRIAELEAKNKALRETAAEFVCATDMLKTKMGTIEQNDRWRAAHASILVLVRDDP